MWNSCPPGPPRCCGPPVSVCCRWRCCRDPRACSWESSGTPVRLATSRSKSPQPASVDLFQIAWADRALLFRDRHQGRIELHKGRIHRAVILVTGVAVGAERLQSGPRLAILRFEERPFAGNARAILDVDFQILHAGLKLARLAEHAGRICVPVFLDQDGDDRPGAGLLERDKSL